MNYPPREWDNSEAATLEPDPRNVGEQHSWNASGQCRSNASQKSETRHRILRGRADFHLNCKPRYGAGAPECARIGVAGQQHAFRNMRIIGAAYPMHLNTVNMIRLLRAGSSFTGPQKFSCVQN